MKIIKVPETRIISFKARGFLRADGKEPDPVTKALSFSEFVKMAVEGTELFGKGLKNIRKGIRIIEKLDSIDGQAELTLEDEDYLALKDAVEGFAWAPTAAMQCVAYLEAIQDAEELKK